MQYQVNINHMISTSLLNLNRDPWKDGNTKHHVSPLNDSLFILICVCILVKAKIWKIFGEDIDKLIYVMDKTGTSCS